MRLHPNIDGRDVAAVFAIAALPFILLAVNDTWIFCQPSFVDNWIYSAFHLHLRELLEVYGSNYYAASRVPWTVPGWAAHAVLGDEAALYVLHFAVFYLAVFSLYVAVRTIFPNIAAAAAAALLFGSNTFFLAAAGWDYVDGASIAYAVLAFAALSSAAIRRRWRLAAVVWGIASCAMVSTYILLVLLVPVQVGVFWSLNRIRGQRGLAAVGAWFVGGGIAALLAFGLINWILGGPFVYIMGQIDALPTVAQKRFEYYQSLSEWAPGARWLIISAITFVFSAAYAAFHFRAAARKIWLRQVSPDGDEPLFICGLAHVAACLIFIGLQANHFYVLQEGYNADALLPYAYVAIGGALASMLQSSAPRRQFGFIAVAFAIALGPWLLADLRLIFPAWTLFRGWGAAAAWIAGGSLLLVVLVQRFRQPWAAAATALLFSIVNLGAASGQMTFSRDPSFKPRMLATFDASRALAPYNPQARALFWYDGRTSDGGVLRNVGVSYLGFVNDEFPVRLMRPNREEVGPGERVVLLTTTDDDPVAAARGALTRLGLAVALAGRTEVRRAGIAVRMFVIDLVPAPSDYDEIESRHAFKSELPAAVVTPAQRFAYASVVPLSDELSEHRGPGYVRVRLTVEDGVVGVGVLTKDERGWIEKRVLTRPFKKRDVFLSVPDLSEAGPLVFLNGGAARAGRATVDDASVYARTRSPSAAAPAEPH